MKTRRTELWRVLVCLAFALSLHAQSELRDKSPRNSGFVTANGVRLHYLDWGGAGETMLFLHGIGDTAHSFDGFAPKFTNQFRVIGLTRRGHGESEVPDSGYDTATRVEDIRQFLDALKVPRVVLVGFSASGGEVTMFAGKHPERTIKAVYLDALIDADGQPALYRRAPPELKRAQDAALGSKRSRVLESMAAGEAHTDYAKIKAPVLAIAVVGFPTNMFDALKDLPEPRRKVAEDALREVLVVKRRETERFRKELPNARLVMLTNANHACFIDREDDVLREMRAFLADSGWTDTSPHKSQFIKVNGVRLHYLDWGGKGETLLFLHGMGGSAHHFDDFAPRFTNQFRVLGLTRRGHGESDAPATGYDTLTLVEDVRQFLDALKIQRVVLAGHSFAGDELTRFAATYADRVIKLIYFDSAYDHSRVPDNLRWKPLHGIVPEILPTNEENESPDGRRRWVNRIWGEKMAPTIYAMIVGTYAEPHDYRKIKAPTLAFFATGYCPSPTADSKCPGFDRNKILAWVESLPEPRRKDAQDLITAQRQYYKQEIEHFRREIPNGRAIVYTNADHVCFFDREPEVLREMRSFLEK